MPLVYGFVALLGSIMPWLVAKIIISLGVGVVSYVGSNALLTTLTSSVLNNAGSISGDIGSFLNLAGLDVCI